MIRWPFCLRSTLVLTEADMAVNKLLAHRDANRAALVAQSVEHTRNRRIGQRLAADPIMKERVG